MLARLFRSLRSPQPAASQLPEPAFVARHVGPTRWCRACQGPVILSHDCPWPALFAMHDRLIRPVSPVQRPTR